LGAGHENYQITILVYFAKRNCSKKKKMTDLLFLFFLFSGILFWAFALFVILKIWFEK